MTNVTKELADLLSYELLGTPFDTSSVHRERFLIEHLTEQLVNWEIGPSTTQELVSAFKEHNLGNFDLVSWIESKADEGVYTLSDEDREELYAT